MKRKSGKKNLTKKTEEQTNDDSNDQNGKALEEDDFPKSKKRRSSKLNKKSTALNMKEEESFASSDEKESESEVETGRGRRKSAKKIRKENSDCDDTSKNIEIKKSPKKSDSKVSLKPGEEKHSENEDDENYETGRARRKNAKKIQKENNDSDDAGNNIEIKKSPKKRDSKISPKPEEEKHSENEDDENYEVEEILGEKMISGVRHYLIRWKGYEEESDTWEPESTLQCPDLIKAFRDRKKNKHQKKKVKKPTWDENEHFEVDRIIEVHHRRDGRREFLVHWKGYPMDDNSWEPEENMDCQELIDKFMLKVNQAKNLEERELRVKPKKVQRYTISATERGRRLSRRFANKERVQYHDSE